MVKIPATIAGLPAITGAIAAGINVNVTLIFSNERYAAVMDAYLKGLEERVAAGLPVDRIASVASFFVSRVDTKVDARLQAIMGEANSDSKGAGTRREGEPGASAQAHDAYNQAVASDRAIVQKAETLGGKAAIANARLAYAAYKEVSGSERFQALKAQGARVQRPLWASTGTKNPAYRDVVYVEELVGPDTVNTVPPATLAAFLDHGVVRPGSLEECLGDASEALTGLESVGISMAQVTDELEQEGLKSFADAFTELLAAVEARRQEAVPSAGPLRRSIGRGWSAAYSAPARMPRRSLQQETWQKRTAQWRWAQRSTSLKQQAADEVLKSIESGMIVGLGHGSTAVLAVRGLGKLLAGGQLKDIQGVACSRQIEDEAQQAEHSAHRAGPAGH